MLRYFVWIVGCTLLLMACDQDLTKSSIPIGTRITQSTQFDQDTIFWNLTNDQAGLIIDTEEDLILDFQEAVLCGKTFGQTPDLHQGTAIKVLKAKKLQIKNADFKAFKLGVVVEQVEELILENCSFNHFFSLPIGALQADNSVALKVEKASVLRLNKVNFKQLDLALKLDKVDHVLIDQSVFAWLKEGVINAKEAVSLSLKGSHLLYLGIPGSQNKIFNLPKVELDVGQNFWAHVYGMEGPKNHLIGKEDQVAYFKTLPEDQWDKPALDALLLKYGVTTPEVVLQDAWVLYDHTYPKAWFRQFQNASDVFLLTAPPGNWRLIDGAGYDRVIPKTGTFPTTLRAEKKVQADSFALEFEYLGKSAQSFGKPYSALEVYKFNGEVPQK